MIPTDIGFVCCGTFELTPFNYSEVHNNFCHGKVSDIRLHKYGISGLFHSWADEQEGYVVSQHSPSLNKKLGLDYESLKEIKQDPVLKSIPVIILTTSERKEDIEECYRNHANSYLTKPVGFKEFEAKVKQIGFYWLLLNKPPVIND